MSAASAPDGDVRTESLALREMLRRRAEIVARVREFFAERGVLEVETPALCASGAVDIHLDPIRVPGAGPACRDLFLMTSPEHSMKRLLAEGCGAVFQICRAYRREERGARHNPEFTLLEWYRPDWTHIELMDEVEGLTRCAFEGREEWGDEPFGRTTYREAFQQALIVDPFSATVAALRDVAIGDGVVVPDGLDPADRDAWLDLLLVERVEPALGKRPTFLMDYPVSQAALARVRAGDPPVAERFELYVDGVELANGYHELTDPAEQRRRFESANVERLRRGREQLPLDERFLGALEKGLPPCAGVALGLDRLVMLALGATRIDDVITFPIERA